MLPVAATPLTCDTAGMGEHSFPPVDLGGAHAFPVGASRERPLGPSAAGSSGSSGRGTSAETLVLPCGGTRTPWVYQKAALEGHKCCGEMVGRGTRRGWLCRAAVAHLGGQQGKEAIGNEGCSGSLNVISQSRTENSLGVRTGP